MGRKSDELREELELANIERIAMARQLDELREKLEKAQTLSAQSLGVALAATGTTPDDIIRHNKANPPHGESWVLGALPATDDLRSKSVDKVRKRQDQQLENDLQAIQELHVPPGTPQKAETTLDVVRANNNERAYLQTTARVNNALISRVASALRVTQWDADGTEILEKAQRWANFGYWLKRRQKSAVGVVANELGTVLAAFEAPQDLAKWIMEKTEGTVPEAAVEVATAGDASAPVRDVGRSDLERLCESTWNSHVSAMARAFLRGDATIKDLTSAIDDSKPQANPLGVTWLSTTLRSERATSELLNFINLVLLPYLWRLQSLSGTNQA